VLQLVTNDDATSEGSFSPNFANLSYLLESYTDAGKPAAGNAGRAIYVTDLGEIQIDNGVIWQAVGGSPGLLSGGVVAKSANYTILSTDNKKIIICDSSGGAFNLTLPTPAAGFAISVKDKLGTFSTNNVTLVRAGSEKIENLAANYAMQADFGSYHIVSDGTDWFLI
jgi:hypothetical protein